MAGARPDGAARRWTGGIELPERRAQSAEGDPPDRYKKYEAGASLRGRITHCDPPRRLSYTWDEDSNAPSEVTFELTPQGADVLLVLTHRRLGDRAGMVNVAGGWQPTSAFSSTI